MSTQKYLRAIETLFSLFSNIYLYYINILLIMQSYNPLGYTFAHKIPKKRVLNMLKNNEFGISMDEQRFKSFLETNNQMRNQIHDMIMSHTNYILTAITQRERHMIQLWTIPEICAALQRVLRGSIQANSTDLERLQAVVELTNNDIYSRGKYIREEIRSLPTQAEKEQKVHDIIQYILDEFVMNLATTVYQAPRLQTYFFTFCGIHGNIVQRHTGLSTNDIIVERGFTSVTWQPLQAIEYAKGDGQDPPSYLMCVGMPSNTHALSVYCVSANPMDREFLLPAGTVLEKTPSGSFNVIGIYERFLNVNDPTQRQYNEWFRPIAPAHTFDRDETDLMTSVQQTLQGHFNFGLNSDSKTAMYRDYLSSIMNKKYIGDKKYITKYNKKPDNTLTSTLSQTLSSSQSRDTTKTGLPYGVQVKQITLPNQKIPTNSVSLNFDVLRHTHDINTYINEKGGISTFFTKKKY